MKRSPGALSIGLLTILSRVLRIARREGELVEKISADMRRALAHPTRRRG